MGDALYDEVVGADKLNIPARIYAPVGSHEDLLAYLVRRLLENGANTSFVNRIVDEAAPIDELIADPVARLRKHMIKPHPRIPLPAKLFGEARRNSRGIDLTDLNELAAAAPGDGARGGGELECCAAAGRRGAERRQPAGHRSCRPPPHRRPGDAKPTRTM